MKIVELKAEPREEIGKNASRKIRAAGKIPAILYGEGIQPEPIIIDARELYNKTHSESGGGVIFKLTVEGEKSYDTIIKDVHRHPLKNSLVHIDFLKIALDEKIHSMVPVTLVGESPGAKAGGVIQHGIWEINVEALPKDVPEHIEVDVGQLEIGNAIRVSDLTSIENVTFLSDPDEVVVTCLHPVKFEEPVVVTEEEAVAEEEAAEAAAAEEGAAPAEAKEEKAEEQ